METNTRTLRRVLAVVLAAVLLCGVAPVTVSAEGADITAAFTDPAFLAAVREEIGKPSGPIYDADAAEVTRLNVYDRNIHSLTGLEHFTALDSLLCSDNQLTALPALPASLEYLACSDNQLTSLPTLPSSLQSLFCIGNQLTSLPALPAGLMELGCQENRLTSLPALPAGLIYLSCRDNQIKALPALPSTLDTLGCAHNQLTKLNVTGVPLTWLNCSYNNMKSKADVKGFTGTWDSENFIFDPQNVTNTVPQKLTLWQWILKYIFFGWLWMNK